MVSLFMPTNPDYSSRAAEIARQQKLADMLTQMGAQDIPVSTAGGITAPVSPYGALAKALTSFGGSYLAGKAAANEAALKQQDTANAINAIKNLYTMPAGSRQPDVGMIDTQGIKEFGPPIPITGKLNLQDTATTPQQQMQMLSPLLAGGPTSQSVYGAFMPEAMKQQAANVELQRQRAALAPLISSLPANQQGLIGKIAAVNPAKATEVYSTLVGEQLKPFTPTEIERKGRLAYGENYLNDPRFIADVKRSLSGVESPERVAQEMAIFGNKAQITADARQKQYGLSDEESNALFGPQGAIARGLINPDRINSRTAHILAGAALANPDLNMVNAAGVAAMIKNPTFQNRAIVAKTLPAIIDNVKDAGKKVDFSDVAFVGKLQAFTKGQLNDPDFISYMAQRNDAIQAITNVMRGIGMSDKSIELELKAAPETMSPKAFEAWAESQQKMLKPRLEQYQPLSISTGGANVPTPTTSQKVRTFNPATGKIE